VVAADQGRRAIAHAQRELLRDLRDRRLALGLSQRTVAGAAGIGRSMLGRIERGEIASPDITDLGAMAAVLGLALRIAIYPQGQPIADRVQLRLLAAFRDRIPQSTGWRTEVPLPVTAGRGMRSSRRLMVGPPSKEYRGWAPWTPPSGGRS
jgi:transcriptional regulator with XRE-family HTH domain